MDNITHAFLGAVLSELAVPINATSTTRRVFVAAGVIASNAPDLDLLYVGITPMPLGYLLHHRGHTHTVLGVIVQAVLLALASELVMRWLTRRRSAIGSAAIDSADASAESCPSHRLAGLGAARAVGGGRLLWSDEIRQPLALLRTLAARDCWVAAWLQFGRAPVLRADRILDLRFENVGGGNFSAMTLRRSADASSCPAHVTPWSMPRADLVSWRGLDDRAVAAME